jgi:hypothetical protein
MRAKVVRNRFLIISFGLLSQRSKGKTKNFVIRSRLKIFIINGPNRKFVETFIMKKIFLFYAGLFFFLFAQAQLPSLPGLSKLTEAEAGDGVKGALNQGIEKAVANLNKTDGFFGSQFYKILLPQEVQNVEPKIRAIGLGNQVDKAILQINRGAEDAVGAAKPIFVDAVKQMSVTDALNLIKGGDGSVTKFFRDKTGAALITAFTPVVKNSLDKAEATKYYGDIISGYNKIPFNRNKLNPDLTSYVVGKAVEALFDQILKEESAIRKDPAKRTTDILKKAFGGTL